MSGTLKRAKNLLPRSLPVHRGVALRVDRFHVMKLIGDAVDEVRRAEIKARPELKGTRYAWTKKDALAVAVKDHISL